ncbi:cyclophilin-like fold protein [Arthrobacter alpinus]|nr:cyclophilin-like fold protein [Arthrobacter alpinus]
MLPLTIPVEEFAGKEKLGALPGSWRRRVPRLRPRRRRSHLLHPVGNLGFYYNADGIGYSDQTIHLGTYNATVAQLAQLEGGAISVEIVK